jgi:hypothetical protein
LCTTTPDTGSRKLKPSTPSNNPKSTLPPPATASANDGPNAANNAGNVTSPSARTVTSTNGACTAKNSAQSSAYFGVDGPPCTTTNSGFNAFASAANAKL